MGDEFDEPRFDRLPAFPANAEPPLPPPKPWYRRLPGLIWRLFPATIVCVPLLGGLSFLLLGVLDIWVGLFSGMAIGAFVGIWIDGKYSLGGGTIDD